MRTASFALLLALACDLGDEGIPEGKLAKVGATVFGPEDVADVQAQLGAYAQLRFVGGEGQQHLLQALVTSELLASEAIAAGLGDDPRVTYAIKEEIATVFESAELERRVPQTAVAADTEALRAYYDAHIDAFTKPERRSVKGVVFKTFAEAEAAIVELRAGRKQLEDYGEVYATKLRERDDKDYPAYHRLLFDPGAKKDTFLDYPVFVGESVMVAFVQAIEPATPESFDDADVRERVVHGLRAERLAAEGEDLRRELRERFPLRAK